MTDVSSQKQIASKILKCGKNRVWINPRKVKEVEGAITTDDVRNLISQGYIKKEQKKGSSKGRARKIRKQKAKGRRKNKGSIKGKIGARFSSKKAWINRIRAIRKMLKNLKNEGKISSKIYRELYNKAKGGFFRSKKHLAIYLERNELVENVSTEEKKEPKNEL